MCVGWISCVRCLVAGFSRRFILLPVGLPGCVPLKCSRVSVLGLFAPLVRILISMCASFPATSCV